MKKLICVLVAALVVGCGDERGGDGVEEDPLIRFDVDSEILSKECLYSSTGGAYADRFTNGLNGFPTISETQIEPGQTSLGPFQVDLKQEWEKYDFREMVIERGPGIVGVVEFSGVRVFLTYVEPGFDPITLTLREEGGAIVGTVRLEKDDLDDNHIHAEFKGMLSARLYDVGDDPVKNYFIDVDTPIGFNLHVMLEIAGVFARSECLD